MHSIKIYKKCSFFLFFHTSNITVKGKMCSSILARTFFFVLFHGISSINLRRSMFQGVHGRELIFWMLLGQTLKKSNLKKISQKNLVIFKWQHSTAVDSFAKIFTFFSFQKFKNCLLHETRPRPFAIAAFEWKAKGLAVRPTRWAGTSPNKVRVWNQNVSND